MLFEVNLPSLSPTMEEGKIVKWIKKKGDYVLSGEVLFEVETDKATMEYESPEDGHLAEIFIDEGSTAKVNQLVALISESKDYSSKDVDAFISSKESDKPSDDIIENKNMNSQVISSDIIEISNSIAITPLARKYAQRNNIDLERITPAMRRIHLADLIAVNDASELNSNKIFITPYAKKLASESGVNTDNIKGSGPLHRIISKDIISNKSMEQPPKINKLRQAIAKATIHSKQNIPHFYLNSKVNMNELLQFRKNQKQKGNKYSFNAIMMHAIAKAFKNFTEANCTYKDNGEFVVHDDINVGIAVDTDTGLKMPVLKNINENNLDNINKDLSNLINLTRDNKISSSELSGGVISISNLGSFNIRSFDAIILPGQTYILAVGQIFEDVYVNKGKIEIASFVNLTLSCDHRAVDGVLASQFFSSLVSNLEKISNV